MFYVKTLQFVPVHSTTSQNLASVIINSLQALGINDKYMVSVRVMMALRP